LRKNYFNKKKKQNRLVKARKLRAFVRLVQSAKNNAHIKRAEAALNTKEKQKMILLSVKNGQKITLDSKPPAKVEEEAAHQMSEDDDEHDLTPTLVDPVTTTTKKQRQRLTHLTADEKLQRRKLKNRIAAQSARDRKKDKFDDLEENVQLLKDQNEQLRIENKLLKEKTQLLIEENRKLLEYKKLSLATFNAKSNVSYERTPLKRKLFSDKEYGLVEVKSAVFNNVVSQPQEQLQPNIIQKLIRVLIVYTMSLISQTASLNNNNNNQMSRDVSTNVYSQKVLRLKEILVKLVKLSKRLQHRDMSPSSQSQMIYLSHKLTTSGLNGQGHKRLLLRLVSLLVKAKA
jgi:hypothetical protein